MPCWRASTGLMQDQLLAVHLHRAMARRKLPAIILTSVDLPAPLSPIRPTTLPGLDRQRNVVDRLDGAEMFRDVARVREPPPAFLPPRVCCAGAVVLPLASLSNSSRKQRLRSFTQMPAWASIVGRIRSGNCRTN